MKVTWVRFKTPLAWLQVTREKTRLAVALAGIAFANILMFMQLGFLGALFTSITIPHKSLQGDLVIVQAQYETLFSIRSFSRDRLLAALACPEVASVNPLSVAPAIWRNPVTRTGRAILVFGVSPERPAFAAAVADLEPLKIPDRVLFDRAARPEYGPVASTYAAGERVVTELSDRQVEVEGLFSVGPSFAADGNIITSETTFLRLFPERSPSKIEVGLLMLKPGADPIQVQRELAGRLPPDVKVLTPQSFAQLEADYWAGSTGIGFIFGLGTIVGFVVGAVIVYQILYADVADHLSEYATLKAMGYTDRYLFGVVVQEGLILAVLGFVPGVVLSLGLYVVAREATLFPISMPFDRLVLVLVLTVGMCAASALIAARKLQAADPADIF